VRLEAKTAQPFGTTIREPFRKPFGFSQRGSPQSPPRCLYFLRHFSNRTLLPKQVIVKAARLAKFVHVGFELFLDALNKCAVDGDIGCESQTYVYSGVFCLDFCDSFMYLVVFH
jgi:hypothetical protein